MSLFRRPRREPMPDRFNELASYNTRVSQGVQHTADYDARMARLQAEFDQWIAARDLGDGIGKVTEQLGDLYTKLGPPPGWAGRKDGER